MRRHLFRILEGVWGLALCGGWMRPPQPSASRGPGHVSPGTPWPTSARHVLPRHGPLRLALAHPGSHRLAPVCSGPPWPVPASSGPPRHAPTLPGSPCPTRLSRPASPRLAPARPFALAHPGQPRPVPARRLAPARSGPPPRPGLPRPAPAGTAPARPGSARPASSRRTPPRPTPPPPRRARAPRTGALNKLRELVPRLISLGTNSS